jgi:hypothetical protein
MHIQAFLIHTQRHSCTLNGCSGDVPTHSLAFTHTLKHSRRSQYSLKGVQAHSQSVQEMFNTDSKAFTHTHKHSGCAQYWLKSIHAHSQAFRECSVLIQMRTFSWSHNGESRSIMTQWHSCALNGCSHSLIGIHAHSQAFRVCSVLTQRCSHALTSVQGVFNTDSKGFMRTHKCSGHVQYWLKGIHVHSQAFRECSVLTQMRTFSWSHHRESCSIMTQWHSCKLNGCSHSLIGVHVHPMGVQGVINTHSLAFIRTQWVFRGCSHSLIGMHANLEVFRKCSARVQPVHLPEGPMNMFSNLQSMQRP